MNRHLNFSLSILFLVGTQIFGSFGNAGNQFTTKPSTPASNTLYSVCGPFDTLGMSYEMSSQKAASAFLNGALYTLETDNITQAELAKRDACVLLALQNGADANNTAGFEPPIVEAVANRDFTAVQYLLQYKANPNAVDKIVMNGSGVSVLHRACEAGDENIAIALLNAGADPNPNQALYQAATSAEVNVVAAMLKSGKIPLNQLSGESNEIGDMRETALDSSELRVSVLQQYFKKMKSSSAADKIMYVNSTLLYAYYIRYPQIKANSDPDSFVAELLKRQQAVSSLLKSAGWTCHQKDCGVDNDDDTSDSSSTQDDSAQDSAN